MVRGILYVLMVTTTALHACGDSDHGNAGDRATGTGDTTATGGSTLPTTPVTVDAGAFTYDLTESTRGLPLWTTPTPSTNQPQRPSRRSCIP